VHLLLLKSSTSFVSLSAVTSSKVTECRRTVDALLDVSSRTLGARELSVLQSQVSRSWFEMLRRWVTQAKTSLSLEERSVLEELI